MHLGKAQGARQKASTEPLSAYRPRKKGVVDLMFIEGRHDVKTPFHVHMGVATKS